MKNKPAQVTEAHRALAMRVVQDQWQRPGLAQIAQLIADGEAIAIAPLEETRRDALDHYNKERDTCDQLRAEVERLKEQHDLIERQIVLPESVPVSYTELARRAECAESEFAATKRGHGELGRYEQLRLKNAELVSELAKERARFVEIRELVSRMRQSLDKHGPNCRFEGVGQISESFVEELEAAIDAAMKEESK